ncbi:MAG: hypothetical protein ACOYYS_13165 [Chloroflexota bacterium]
MSLIAGLYTTREQASAAYRALQETGFREEDLAMLVRKPITPPEFKRSASLGNVARSALVGALLLGLPAALLAFLVGSGAIPVRQFFPAFDPGQWRLTLSLVAIVSGMCAVTGAILGAAAVLLFSSEKAAITTQGVKRGGLLLVVNAGEDAHKEDIAHVVMESQGAVDVENLTETWDARVWSQYEGVEIPPTGQAAGTRAVEK